MNALLADRRFLLALLAIALVKLALAHFLPMTGDEAYFIFWAQYPDYGYYDHPPMVGWLLAAFLALGDAEVWLRLPAVLISLFIGAAIYALVAPSGRELARWSALLYLLTPINLVGILVTTDTPLLLWSFLSALVFYRAQRTGRLGEYLLCGFLLGLAFFSKFFAGLLGIAYAVFLLVHVRRQRRAVVALAAIVVGTLPAIGLNLWWNYNHCWNNYLFNLVNRTQGNGIGLEYVIKYGLLLLYLLTPALIYYIYRARRVLWQQFLTPVGGVFIGLFFIPIGLFLLLSLTASIGLHWLLSFYPFLVLGLAQAIGTTAMRRSTYVMLAFSAVHMIVLAVIIAGAPRLLDGLGEDYKSVVIGTNGPQLAQLALEHEGYVPATDSYALSAKLSYDGKTHFAVFGEGSYHGRQDDLITDFRQLDGHNFAILAENPMDYRFAWFFDEFEQRAVDIEGARFYLVLGRGFRFQRYRDEMLTWITQRYYAVPQGMPRGRCYMEERYGLSAER